MWKLLFEVTFDKPIPNGIPPSKDRMMLVASTWDQAHKHAERVAADNHTEVNTLHKFQMVWLCQQDVTRG
jgi:hypothetical protein